VFSGGVVGRRGNAACPSDCSPDPYSRLMACSPLRGPGRGATARRQRLAIPISLSYREGRREEESILERHPFVENPGMIARQESSSFNWNRTYLLIKNPFEEPRFLSISGDWPGHRKESRWGRIPIGNGSA